MKKISIGDRINVGKSKDIPVVDLIKEKGKIFSMIKEGYVFDDEVLSAAHVTKVIRDERVYSTVKDKGVERIKKLPKDTVSIKQIISELNTITKNQKENNEDKFAYYNNQIDDTSLDNYYGDDE